MMNLPLISIIVPNYNGSKYIVSTIESITNQSYTNWELIIVDDCSSDNSVDLIKKYTKKFPNKIYLHQLNNNSGGPATPRNFALNQSKGEYIAFVDSDDIWHPSKLDVQISIMLSKNLNFTSSKICEFSSEKEIQDCKNHFIHHNNNIRLSKITHYQMLLKNRIRSGSTSIVHKNLIDEHNISFNTDKNYVAVEDYLFWLDIMGKTAHDCYRLEIPLTFYRISLTSISKGKVKMAKKTFNLLTVYLRNNKFRGLNYFFFCTYFFLSLIDKLKNKKCECEK